MTLKTRLAEIELKLERLSTELENRDSIFSHFEIQRKINATLAEKDEIISKIIASDEA